jgi:hypothetical protein
MSHKLAKPAAWLGRLLYPLRYASDLAKIMPFIGLDLPSRAVSALNHNGITSVDQLLDLNIREVRALDRVGPDTVDLILDAVAKAGLALVPHPWASYVCVRHGSEAADANLATFILCPECRGTYVYSGFSGALPDWVGSEAIEGYCGNCNELRPDLSMVQWHLCGTCERVVRSLGGRSLAATKYVLKVWMR